MFNLIARGLTVATMVLASTTFALAETSATPVSNVVAQASAAPTASPNPFSYKGYIRSYYFTRQNASGNNSGAGPAGKPQVNQATLNTAISLHGEYKFNPSPLSVGATYLYANPFGTCSRASDYALIAPTNAAPPCKSFKPPSTNPDYTLPPFVLSTLYEAYLQYKDANFYGKLGDQVINTPWAPNSDSRLKPSAFRGIDVVYSINKQWALQASDYTAFESRASSDFSRSTLLTSYPIDDPGIPSDINNTLGQPIFTNGFAYGRVGYTGSNFGGNAHVYAFQNIANLLWLDGKYAWKNKWSPYVAGQFGTESNTGSAVIGKISSQVYGLQAGANVTPNVQVVVGYDGMPWKSDSLNTATLAAQGVSCSNTSNQIKVMAGHAFGYFLPTNAPQCFSDPSTGQTTVFYGGIASPYSDSYATDPLFTTSISQGAVDRRAPGNSFKAAVNFTSDDKRFKAFVSRSWYNFGNLLGSQRTQEINIDAMYYFSKIPKTGNYRGLLLRHRYVERTYSTIQYGGLPLFKYNRTQLEYDF